MMDDQSEQILIASNNPMVSSVNRAVPVQVSAHHEFIDNRDSSSSHPSLASHFSPFPSSSFILFAVVPFDVMFHFFSIFVIPAHTLGRRLINSGCGCDTSWSPH